MILQSKFWGTIQAHVKTVCTVRLKTERVLMLLFWQYPASGVTKTIYMKFSRRIRIFSASWCNADLHVPGKTMLYLQLVTNSWCGKRNYIHMVNEYKLNVHHMHGGGVTYRYITFIYLVWLPGKMTFQFEVCTK